MIQHYKAIPFTVTTHHDEVVNDTEPWENCMAFDTTETRFCIVSTDTGDILDNAQGYGYKTPQKAYRGFSYKNRDKSQNKERLEKKKRIESWMNQHKSFVKLMDDCAFEIAKGAMSPDDKFDAKFVRNLLQEEGLEPDFTAEELLRAWSNKKC